MEVASSFPPQPTNGTNLNPSTMDTSMDIDMDLDLGPLPEPEHVATEAQVPSVTAEEAVASSHLNEEPQFEKVHIRGVDELTTEDLKRYASEHFVTEEPTRIEWIDDTSANLVYSCADIGLQALATFSQQNPEEDPSSLQSLRLRTAKSLSTHPESVLQVRAAVKTDRKRQRAHESSRFYLMHPEHDPRERMRREFADRRRSGRRDDSDSDYSRRRFDDKEHQRRRGRANEENFNESMYDDDGGRSRARSGSNEGRLNGDRGRDRSRRDRRDGIELFPDDGAGSSGRLRDRSASPLRMEFDQEDPTMDSRERTRKSFRNRSPRNSRSRDLMSRANAYATSDDSSGRLELFPNKTTSSYLKSELFPKKSTSSNHRRSDAFDAADETADLFSKHMPVPLMDGASGGEASGRSTGPVELFPDKSDDNGFSIRSAASEDRGISIRGASQGISIKGAASVRELFPSKYSSNEGKELFSDKLQGRGGKRRKAEDMFS